ncbi:glycosyltransferase [Mameliella sediminis]|uniref:glycosyltransferase n=1 Tax=Mameliella sediminis TaxID=2836866 RepID=UPI001C47BD16|nr:glycosyltransferase family 2 protein [Mameliella sediminis]MBV7395180.1 glycosyltransferase family 2 protein [Mameliella sediminis]
MDRATQGRGVTVSVILPASNEAALIGDCLDALLASEVAVDHAVEVIVVANGCRDETADRARARADRMADKGWRLKVIERAEGSKPGALNAGDAAASGAIRVYLDADVTVAPDLLAQLVRVLDVAAPRYASGQVEIAADGAVSRAYARIWRRVPFMRDVVPGCGLFAVNAAGRARWGAFPQIISDDIYVRLHFRPGERVGVTAPYRWPIAEGWHNLVKVRRRQNAGVDEIAARYPALTENDDKPRFPLPEKLGLALRDPVGFGIYSGVALAVKLTPRAQQDWSRGR